MKKNLLIYFIITSLLVACGNAPKEIIVKKWRISVDEMVKLLPKDKRELYTKYSEQQKKEAKIALESATWEFKSNGAFELTNKNDKAKPTIKGKWKLSEDAKSLTITADNKQDVMKVSYLSDKKMVIEGDSGFVFVPAK